MFYNPTEYKLNSYIFDILIAPWRHKPALNSAMIGSIRVQPNLRSPFTFLLIFARIILEYSANGLQEIKVFHSSFFMIYCQEKQLATSISSWTEVVFRLREYFLYCCDENCCGFIEDGNKEAVKGLPSALNPKGSIPFCYLQSRDWIHWIPPRFLPFPNVFNLLNNVFFPCFFAKTYRCQTVALGNLFIFLINKTAVKRW